MMDGRLLDGWFQQVYWVHAPRAPNSPHAPPYSFWSSPTFAPPETEQFQQEQEVQPPHRLQCSVVAAAPVSCCSFT